MSKKNGALFSKSLFGYKRSDVIDYIRVTDQTHVDEIARISAEKDLLADRLSKAEITIKELESAMTNERTAAQEKVKKLTLEYEKRIAELANAQNAVKDKLNESETRASSYLKLADTSSVRAETAEAELTVISAALENSRAEIEALNKKLTEKEDEAKRIAELEALAKRMIASNSENSKSNKRKLFFIKRPLFFGNNRKK